MISFIDRPLAFSIIWLVLTVTAASAQEGAKGSIQGKVTDGKTGEPLPSVNIVVKGTYYGAATNFEGNFFIKDINPGVYIAEVSLIG